MSANRQAVNVLLAVLDIEQGELADLMGYRHGYVANIFNGFTEPSDAFKTALGEVLADLLVGPSRTANKHLPAEPLVRFLDQRALSAPSRSQFYADLGLTRNGWNKRQRVPESLVDRVCCALGVHPSAIYGHDYEVGDAS